MHEWDIDTENQNFALGMGLGLFLPGGTQFYTGHYVRGGFIAALEIYLLSEIFYNYDLRVEVRRKRAQAQLEEAEVFVDSMVNAPTSSKYYLWQSSFVEKVQNARQNNDVIEEQSGLLHSEKAWLLGIHLYSLMDGYGILRNNEGRSNEQRAVWSAVWRAALIPGWGQIYNREWGKAGLLYMAGIGSVASFQARQHTVEYYSKRMRIAKVEGNFEEIQYIADKQLFFRKKRNQYIWAGMLFYLYSIADAAVDALLSDFDSPNYLSMELPSSGRPGMVLALRF